MHGPENTLKESVAVGEKRHIGFDDKEQGKLAIKAQECAESRAALLKSLQPLIKYIVNDIVQAYMDSHADTGLTENLLKTKLKGAVEPALKDALAAYNNDQKYKFGTFFNGFLRMHARQVLKSVYH